MTLVDTAFEGLRIAAGMAWKTGWSLVLGFAVSAVLQATFSLTAMVSAYSGATSNITPRAVQLLIEDSTAQNALATFLGSFLFAIVGIIALSTGLYGETGRVILYAGTILVIIVIVVTFVRWIEHIARFGRVSDTIDRAERAAMKAVHGMAQRPRFGPRERILIPEGMTTIRDSRIGRITYVDLAQLADVAEEVGAEVNLVALPGMLIDPARLLAWTTAPLAERQLRSIRNAFSIEHSRSFDHDPRFGLIVLSEIASRALSPAVNDPGTAIAVIEAGTRVMAGILRHSPDPDRAPPSGVNVPTFAFPDLLADLYRPIARDGAGIVEVGARLQKALAALQSIEPDAGLDCGTIAGDALSRAIAACDSAVDAERLSKIYRRYWPGHKKPAAG